MSLKVLELKSNLLTGSIPAEVGNVKKLTLLTLSHNQLKGNVPTEFAMLSNIELIHIHDNRLTGTFPEMKKLEDLGGESLIGKIPVSLKFSYCLDLKFLSIVIMVIFPTYSIQNK